MRYAAIIFLVPLMFVFMFQAHAGSALQTGVIVSSAPLTTLAFNHRPMPRPRMRPVHVRRPVFGRPVVRRPVYRRPVTVVAPMVTVAPPPRVVVTSKPVRHVRLPLAEPVVINQQTSASGHYEVRTRIAPSGERYEERVWVSVP